MLNNSTLKQTFLIGLVICALAAGCSNDGGRGEQPAAPDTTVAEPDTTVAATVDEPAPTTSEVVIVEPPTTIDTAVGDTTTTTSEPVVTEPPEPIHGVVTLPPEIEDLLIPEPVVITAPPTTAPATTTPEPADPETTEPSTDESSTTTTQTTAPATTEPSGPVSEPITDSGAMWTPDDFGFHPDDPGPKPLPATDWLHLEPGMALTFDIPLIRPMDRLEGAVIIEILYYFAPVQTFARVCVDGDEWSLRLARSLTEEGQYRIVLGSEVRDRDGNLIGNDPQASPTGERC